MRNPGLALLVAALNRVPPEIKATILAYLLITVLAYIVWRRRTVSTRLSG
jgi:hypothetical protein